MKRTAPPSSSDQPVRTIRFKEWVRVDRIRSRPYRPDEILVPAQR